MKLSKITTKTCKESPLRPCANTESCWSQPERKSEVQKSTFAKLIIKTSSRTSKLTSSKQWPKETPLALQVLLLHPLGTLML